MKILPQLEFQALTLLDALKSGQAPAEAGSNRAHFATWPGPPRRAARLLAAQANAARGRDLLWLIGVKTGKFGGKGTGHLRVTGARLPELDRWLNQLLPFFDGLAPKVQAFVIPYGANGKTPARQVVALHVQSARAPFVVRAAENGPSFDVPWWDSSAGEIRSAGRNELVKLLVPLQDLPQFEVLDAELTFYKNPHATLGSKNLHRWTLDGSLYVIPPSEARAMVPLHRCSGSLHVPGSAFHAAAQDVNVTADKLSPSVRVTESAILIEGLGRMFIYCSGSTTAPEIPWHSPLTATFDLLPTGAERASVATATLYPLPPVEANQAGRWKL